MRAGALVAAVMALCTACSGGGETLPTIPPDDIVTLDFVGQLTAADTSRWEQFFDGSPDDIYRNSSGGRSGPLLVGPATLTLDDGAVVDVAAGTPGGNLCPQLDLYQQPPDPPPGLQPGEICLVVGRYLPGTTTAAWFATLRVRPTDLGYWMPVGQYDAGRALVGVADVFASVAISPDVAIDCFGLRFADMLADRLPADALVDATFQQVLALGCIGQE